MSATLAAPPATETEAPEQGFGRHRVSWNAYQSISDEQRGVRLIGFDGSLLFMGKSRRHEWLADMLGHCVAGIATQLGVACEPAGAATYRRREQQAGLEGDRTFHLGANAERMRGGLDDDFGADPPPDLVIEVGVEVGHAAELAVQAWGRMGVPEIWRFDNKHFTCAFWKRRDDGSYESLDRSMCLPMLEPGDLVALIGRAQEVGVVACLAELPGWVDRVLRARTAGGP